MEVQRVCGVDLYMYTQEDYYGLEAGAQQLSYSRATPSWSNSGVALKLLWRYFKGKCTEVHKAKKKKVILPSSRKI